MSPRFKSLERRHAARPRHSLVRPLLSLIALEICFLGGYGWNTLRSIRGPDRTIARPWAVARSETAGWRRHAYNLADDPEIGTVAPGLTLIASDGKPTRVDRMARPTFILVAADDST